MSSKFKKLENSTGEILVTSSGETWKKAQTKVFNKVVSETKIDGFRKGKAPKHLVEKQINKQALLSEAVEEVASELLIEAIKEHDLQIISRPELDIVAISEEAADLKFVVALKPDVTLGDYKGLEIKREKVSVKKADIDKEIEKLREEFAELLLKEEGSVVNGDTAVINFEGFLDDVAFEGGKGENHPLEIGSGSFIPGFEEQLIGLKSGDKKDVKVTFPEAYQAEHLAGKEVTFKVDVLEIKEKK
ncbi:MAG: trigger factor, partial [Erysipelotrichaceae bacterium]